MAARATTLTPRVGHRSKTSSARLDLAPEGVDAGVELVRHLLEGLVGLPGITSNRAPGIPSATSARGEAGKDVELPGQHQRRRGDPARRSSVSWA